LHCRFQGRGEGGLDLGEDRQDPLADRRVIARLGGEVAVEATVAGVALVEVGLVGGEVIPQPDQGREFLVQERPPHRLAAADEVEIDHLEGEGLFRGEMIGERSKRCSRRLDDVADAGGAEAPLMDHAEPFAQDLVPVGWLGHI